jgi:hypothetical protein
MKDTSKLYTLIFLSLLIPDMHVSTNQIHSRNAVSYFCGIYFSKYQYQNLHKGKIGKTDYVRQYTQCSAVCTAEKWLADVGRHAPN